MTLEQQQVSRLSACSRIAFWQANRRARLLWGILTLGITLASPGARVAFSQTNFGQINGTVYDPTGGVIPGAQVTLGCPVSAENGESSR